jgi:hypothetical protein
MAFIRLIRVEFRRVEFRPAKPFFRVVLKINGELSATPTFVLRVVEKSVSAIFEIRVLGPCRVGSPVCGSRGETILRLFVVFVVFDLPFVCFLPFCPKPSPAKAIAEITIAMVIKFFLNIFRFCSFFVLL